VADDSYSLFTNHQTVANKPKGRNFKTISIDGVPNKKPDQFPNHMVGGELMTA